MVIKLFVCYTKISIGFRYSIYSNWICKAMKNQTEWVNSLETHMICMLWQHFHVKRMKYNWINLGYDREVQELSLFVLVVPSWWTVGQASSCVLARPGSASCARQLWCLIHWSAPLPTVSLLGPSCQSSCSWMFPSCPPDAASSAIHWRKGGGYQGLKYLHNTSKQTVYNSCT